MEMKVCLVAAGFFLLLGTVTAQNAGKVFPDPPSGKLVTGKWLSLTCKLDNGNDVAATVVVWKKDAGANPLVDKDNLQISGNNKETLQISRVVPTDSGIYTCKPGTKTESAGSTVVVEAPRLPTLTCDPSGALKVGATTKCTCASTNDASVTPDKYVFKLDTTVKPAEGTNTPKNELTVTGDTALNGKDVSCQVRFTGEPLSFSEERKVTLTIETTTTPGPTTMTTAAPSTTTTTTTAGCESGASISLMTTGFLLLLSTLLMKE